jgi:Lrp/AsnC family leucine-responsive transcriptional regulator
VTRLSRRRLDALDLRVLRLIQSDARRSSAELARRVDLSGPGLQKRLRKLEKNGIIQRYAAIVDREGVGLDLLCFVQVSLAHHEPRTVEGFRDAVREMPEVLECHYLTGEFDYLLKVVAANHKHLEQFLFKKLNQARGVDRMRTSIVLNEIKQSTALPLGAWDDGGKRWVEAKEAKR